MSLRFQVAIIGGGLVGASLALLLVARARIAARDILLVEPKAPAPLIPDAVFDLRVSAVSPGNRALLADLGVWQGLPQSRVASYERMVVWSEELPPDSPDVLRFDAAELGEPDLGSIVENRALQSALWVQCVEQGVILRHDVLKTLRIDATAARLGFGASSNRGDADADADGAVDAELVIGADGAASTVRTLLGIDSREHDYGQRGIVATVRSELSHQRTAWQRFLHTGPLALLPLANGESSIVWSALDDRAATLLAMNDNDFSAALTTASAGVLGRIEPTSARAAFPLRRLTAANYVAPRAALIGDAAHVIHPLAGQGVNQGFADALCLAESLAARPARESPGALGPLLKFQRERRAGNVAMGSMVDSLNGLFTDSGSLRRWIGREGLALAGRSPIARRFFFTQAATGRSSLHR
jgi:2-polyprenylphenol 6-hydroxylase